MINYPKSKHSLTTVESESAKTTGSSIFLLHLGNEAEQVMSINPIYNLDKSSSLTDMPTNQILPLQTLYYS